VSTAFEFDFNAEVANHLGCPVLIVASGQGKTSDEVVRAARTAHEAFVEQGCLVAATMVNRVAADTREEVVRQLKRTGPVEEPVYVLPEEETLGKPTVREIAGSLGGEPVFGTDRGLNREVRGYKVAAMQLPNFLDHIQEGCLIITPGDRSDVLLGTLATVASQHHPNIAGVLLTGGLAPAPQVKRLIEGVGTWTVPIFRVHTDTYATAMEVTSVRAVIAPDNDRKIATALGVFESNVDIAELENQIAVARSARVTPLMFEYELVERAKADRQHIVLPEGTDERILRASDILLRRGVVEITLLGPEAEIRQKVTSLGLNLQEASIVDPAKSAWLEDHAHCYFELRKHRGITEEAARDTLHDVSYFGAMMVYQDVADGMVSGAAHTTAHTLRPAFEIIRTRPGSSIISSVFFMCLEDRVLVYGDCAVNPNPDPEQLADIAISSATTAAVFGVEPRVAMLSYSTGMSGTGEDVDKVREATRIARERRPDLPIEGPIQYDAAVDASVARMKMPESEVAGHATVFIFPDLNTGNNTYKAVQRSANAVAIGPVVQGLSKPVNDLSRGCTVTDIVNTVAITAIQAQATRSES
jgi:phosphate acetyltransferase